jgi:transposase
VIVSDRVVIGMDPHKRSATIEVMAGEETVLGTGRFDTDRAGFAAMVVYAKQWPNRVWAIEGCEGIGRHIASRLLADGEEIVDVPPKLSARARVFVTGQGRKTDATDAHFRRCGRHAGEWAAAGGQRRAVGCAAAAGRPSPLAGR